MSGKSSISGSSPEGYFRFLLPGFLGMLLITCSPRRDHLKEAYREAGENDFLGAIIELNQLLAQHPSNDSALLLRARCYNRIEKHEKAKTDLEHLLELYPGHTEGRVEYARMQAYLGDTAAALDVLSKISGAGIPVSEAWILSGQLHFYRKQYERVPGDLNRAIEADSSNDRAWYYRGVFYSSFVDGRDTFHLKYYPYINFEQALSDLTQALHLNPGLADAWYKRGLVHINMFNDRKGLEDISQSIRLDPKNAAYYFSRAEYYRKRGEHELARRDYKKAGELKPEE